MWMVTSFEEQLLYAPKKFQKNPLGGKSGISQKQILRRLFPNSNSRLF